MSYDLAVWTGPQPADDDAAAEEYERRTARWDDDVELDEGDPGAPASPAIRAFLDDLLSAYPALGEHGDENSPWATGPEPGDVDGDFVYLTMTYPGARAALDGVVAVARRHGLVCYDPQTGALATGTG